MSKKVNAIKQMMTVTSCHECLQHYSKRRGGTQVEGHCRQAGRLMMVRDELEVINEDPSFPIPNDCPKKTFEHVC